MSELTTDEDLLSVALRIREADDFPTAINEGFHLGREVDSNDLMIAQNHKALLQIMFPDELDQLSTVFRRASDEPELSPLVRAYLVFAQFWPSHERNRRKDNAYKALVDSYSGHLLYLVDEDCLDPPAWSWFCVCNQDETPDYTDRKTAEAAMRFHMALHDLPESAIYDMDVEDQDG